MTTATVDKEIFDFPIQRVPSIVNVNGVELKTERDCIVRTDTNKIVGYVSAQTIEVEKDGKVENKQQGYYKIVPHVEVVTKAREIINNLGLTFTEKTDLIGDGARLYHTFEFPNDVVEIPRKNLKVGDYVNMKLTVMNSYDLSKKAGYELGGIRKVCTNGLMLFKAAFYSMYKHTGGFDFNKAVEDLAQGIQTFRMDLVNQMSLLDETEITTAEGKALIEGFIKDKTVPEKYGLAIAKVWDDPENANAVVPVYDADGDVLEDEYQTVMTNPEYDEARTLWTFYNAFTLILTHMVLSFERRRLMYEAIQRKIHAVAQAKRS